MNHKTMTLRLTAVFLLFLGLMAAISLTTAGQPTAQANAPATYLTNNGIQLTAGQPIPVFIFQAPQVSADGSVRPLGGRLGAIGFETGLEQAPYLNQPRFTMFNEETGAILEQYGATGGFYAFNATEAFSETFRGELDPIQAQYLACMMLYDYNQMLLPDNDLISTPNVVSCDYDFNNNPYIVSPIQAAAADAMGRSLSEPETIGLVVQVPMFVRTARFSRIPQVPLGGAGGHISMLFRTTNPDDDGFSLDQNTPGLGALAMPFYGRSLEFLNNFPARDIGEVRELIEKTVWESYPGASRVDVPDPDLLYMPSDAAQVQKILEPMFEFEGIEVEVDGELIILRSIAVSAVEPGSLGPEVAITSPADGSFFKPNTAVSFTGIITGGEAPYTYSWQVEDTIFMTGTLPTMGEVSATAEDLAVDGRTSTAASVIVMLEVEDNQGVVRHAMLNLFQETPALSYLPMIRGDGTAVSMTRAIEAPTAVYRFGVHAGSDYPPYGPGGSDLPGVIPDVNGFRSSMMNYGWISTYNWWNANAWEKDWRDCSLGGIDCTQGVDRVDFAYYAGHGGPGGLSMPNKTQDSGWFDGNKARYSTLRWAGFASCQTLRVQGYAAGSEPIRRWFGAFQGAHMLLGYNSNMRDVAFGPRLVDNMRPVTFFGITISQRSVREAWVQTAFQMNAGKPAYIYAKGTNGVNPYNHRLPRQGDPALARPYPVASYHWVWWNE